MFGAGYTRELQRIAVEETRLGIPLIFGYDVIHGHRTIFPIPLAEAAAFDPELWERTAKIAALEAACCGLPVITIAHADNAAQQLVVDGTTGFLVSLSPLELAGRIAELLRDETLRSKMSSAATRFASR